MLLYLISWTTSPQYPWHQESALSKTVCIPQTVKTEIVSGWLRHITLNVLSISNRMLLLIWQEKPIHILKVGDPCCRLFLLRKGFSYRIGNWDSERSSNQLKAKSKGNTGCEIWLQVLCTPSIFPPTYDTESLKGKLHVSLDGSKISQECAFQHQLVNSPETRPVNHHLVLQSAHKHPLSRLGQ